MTFMCHRIKFTPGVAFFKVFVPNHFIFMGIDFVFSEEIEVILLSGVDEELVIKWIILVSFIFIVTLVIRIMSY